MVALVPDCRIDIDLVGFAAREDQEISQLSLLAAGEADREVEIIAGIIRSADDRSGSLPSVILDPNRGIPHLSRETIKRVNVPVYFPGVGHDNTSTNATKG